MQGISLYGMVLGLRTGKNVRALGRCVDRFGGVRQGGVSGESSERGSYGGADQDADEDASNDN